MHSCRLATAVGSKRVHLAIPGGGCLVCPDRDVQTRHCWPKPTRQSFHHLCRCRADGGRAPNRNRYRYRFGHAIAPDGSDLSGVRTRSLTGNDLAVRAVKKHKVTYKNGANLAGAKLTNVKMNKVKAAGVHLPGNTNGASFNGANTKRAKDLKKQPCTHNANVGGFPGQQPGKPPT